jgi:hypothetical protein
MVRFFQASRRFLHDFSHAKGPSAELKRIFRFSARRAGSAHFFFFFAGRLAAFAAASAALAWAALFFSARAARAFTLGFPSGILGIGIPLFGLVLVRRDRERASAQVSNRWSNAPFAS